MPRPAGWGLLEDEDLVRLSLASGSPEWAGFDLMVGEEFVDRPDDVSCGWGEGWFG